MLVKLTTISDLHCFSRGCAPPRTTHQALLLSSGDVLAGKCWTIRSAIRSQLRWPAYSLTWLNRRSVAVDRRCGVVTTTGAPQRWCSSPTSVYLRSTCRVTSRDGPCLRCRTSSAVDQDAVQSWPYSTVDTASCRCSSSPCCMYDARASN